MEARIRRHYSSIASGKSKPPLRQSATPSTAQSSEPAKPSPFSFPASYPAHLAVHIILIIASFVLLPRSIALERLPEQLRNVDRPQHPFLAPITARPETTALWAALGNALLVGWWSGNVREWFREGKIGFGVKERVQDESKPTDIWNATVFTSYAALAYIFTVVLFGAPLSTHLVHTTLLSINLAILTVLAPAYAIGIPVLPFNLPLVLSIRVARDSGSALVLNNTWVRLFAERKPQTPAERAVVYPAIGALLGAWVGVIPIGLDWDRPWQAYPLTPLFGATIGYVLGSFFALALSTVHFFAAHDLRTVEPKTPPSKSDTRQKSDRRAKKS